MAALVIDTNVAGHFRHEDEPDLDLFLAEFASRVKLEDAILKIAVSDEGG
ncbi:MAG: hypothetical protein ACRC33_20880 [Gemmataceae bacterium]